MKTEKSSVGHTMIDMTATMLQSFTAWELKQHVFEGMSSGNSGDLLDRLLLPGSSRHVVAPEDIPSALGQFGPGLVSNFTVYDDFMEREVHHHHGNPKGSVRGSLALVVVGTRHGPDGTLYVR